MTEPSRRPAQRFWRQVGSITYRDLRVEGRALEVMGVAVPFGGAALLLAPFAFGVDASLLARIGPPLYWVVGLLFGMQVTFRVTAAETPPHRDLLALLGVDPAARFVGRVAASASLLVAFLAILAPVMIVLYAPPTFSGWGWAVPVIVAFAIGLAMVGTLNSELVAGLRTRALLAPLLTIPLAAPLLIAATEAVESLRRRGGILTWALLLVLTDLVLAVVGVLTARPLEEANR